MTLYYGDVILICREQKNKMLNSNLLVILEGHNVLLTHVWSFLFCFIYRLNKQYCKLNEFLSLKLHVDE